MKLSNRLKITKLFVQLVLNPKRTELIFKGVKILSEDPNEIIFTEIEKKYLMSEDFMALYKSGYNPDPPSNAELSKYGEGTFGHAVYEHLSKNNLSLAIFPRFECRRPVEFLSLRAYQDHDLWHVLLGYGVELEDELAVQAFGAAQYGSPVATLLIAGGLLHLLWKEPLRAVKGLGQVSDAFQIGKRTKLLIGLKLHPMFSLPLEEARKLCGMSNVTNGAGNIIFDAAIIQR